MSDINDKELMALIETLIETKNQILDAVRVKRRHEVAEKLYHIFVDGLDYTSVAKRFRAIRDLAARKEIAWPWNERLLEAAELFEVENAKNAAIFQTATDDIRE